MGSEDLGAVLNPRRVKGKTSFGWLFLFLLGLFFLAWPILPGWEAARERLGLDHLWRLLIAFLFFLCASFLRSLNHLQSKVSELAEAVDVANCSLYGKNWRAERDAVTFLISLLSSPNEDLRKKSLANLKKLTGRDFGEDQGQWEMWWVENRPSFRRAAGEKQE